MKTTNVYIAMSRALNLLTAGFDATSVYAGRMMHALV
jgi:hypothetical protein